EPELLAELDGGLARVGVGRAVAVVVADVVAGAHAGCVGVAERGVFQEGDVRGGGGRGRGGADRGGRGHGEGSQQQAETVGGWFPREHEVSFSSSSPANPPIQRENRRTGSLYACK